MATTETLTEREQQALEHMRKAQELGVTLKEYAGRFGLDVQKLYQLRKPLVRKGALGPARSQTPEPRRVEKTGAFLPVRVVCSAPTPDSTCGGVPPGASEWLRARVRWITAGLLDGGGLGRRCPCYDLAHRTYQWRIVGQAATGN